MFNSDFFENTTSTGGFDIDNSLRFNNDDSANLNRTFGTATNRKKWTWSGWVKPSSGDSQNGFFFVAGTGGSQNDAMNFTSTNQLDISAYSGGYDFRYRTTAVYRDPSAWYHLFVVYDSTQGTPSDRVKIYINNSLVTDFVTETNPSLDAEVYFNSSVAHYIGRSIAPVDPIDYLDAYLAEVHFIDGQALTPSDFGEEDTDYKHWKPIAYAGSYGNNGFHLDFKVAGTGTTGAGKDVSGEGNHWATSGIASTDQMLDTPTNNFCTLNPISKLVNSAASGTMSEGNLKTHLTTPDSENFGTMAVSTGKWYWEVYTAVSAYGTHMAAVDLGSHKGLTVSSGRSYISVAGGTPTVYDAGTESFGGTSVPSVSSTDVLGIALDLDNGAVYTSINGVFSNSGDPTSGASKTGATVTSSIHTKLASGVGEWTPMYVDGGSGDRGIILNCGQDSSFAGNVTAGTETDDNSNGSFKYDVPAGFLALCTKNLPDPAVKPQENFDVVAYAGTSATKTISSLSLQPDFLWIKARSGDSQQHLLVDSVRGTYTSSAGKTLYRELYLNDALVENHYDSNYGAVSALTSNGFSLDTDSSWPFVNESGRTYVAWNWKAGGADVLNEVGTIDSQVSANADAGFSIVSYTGTGVNNATVGHGLSKAPEMVIIKNRIDALHWFVHHQYHGATPEYRYRLLLNTTGARTYDTGWLEANPTASVFQLGTSGYTNGTSDGMIAYCFHSVDGYSKVGSYTGNASADGTFAYTGFRPAYVMLKASSSSGSWNTYDSGREPYNVLTTKLIANGAVPDDVSTDNSIDFLSNGFKCRSLDATNNGSGGTYIYLAFAEHPFKYTTAR